jgi:hypothetical protein
LYNDFGSGISAEEEVVGVEVSPHRILVQIKEIRAWIGSMTRLVYQHEIAIPEDWTAVDIVADGPPVVIGFDFKPQCLIHLIVQREDERRAGWVSKSTTGAGER